MKNQIQYALGLLGVGAALIAYAHANFASKSMVERMDERIFEIYRRLVPEGDRK